MINHDFYTFITNGNFSDYNISVYEKDHNISDKQLLKNSFKFLFSYIPNKLKNNEFSINITINTINLICILFLSNNFDNEEIIVNKKRIATAKKMILSFLKKNKNQKLLDAMNKIDSIILDKEININDLVKLIKELIDRKEYDAIISKIIKINKEVLDHNNCELFDIVFDKTMNSIKNDDNDAYYYISLLKILYTNKINKDYYIFKLDEICNHNLFYRELYSIINGKMVCLKENEILEKYYIEKALPSFDAPFILPSSFDDTIITIDDFNTRISDDGLSFKKDGNKFIVGIHITDVVNYIKPRSIFDLQARQNFKTIYTENGNRIPIFDNSLESKLSLNQNENHQTISIYAVFDSSYTLIDYYLTKGNVRISKNLNLLETDKILDCKNLSDDFSKNIIDLYDIASSINDDNKAKERYWKKKGSDLNLCKSEIIISEFSILFNRLLALIAYENNCTYVYKYQDPEYLSKLIDVLNIRKCDLLNDIISNIYLNSEYSLEPKLHSGLNEPIYSSSSNPLRNYPDTFNQYLIHAQYFKDLSLPYNEDEIESIINYFNKRKSEMLLLNRELNKSLKLKKHS